MSSTPLAFTGTRRKPNCWDQLESSVALRKTITPPLGSALDLTYTTSQLWSFSFFRPLVVSLSDVFVVFMYDSFWIAWLHSEPWNQKFEVYTPDRSDWWRWPLSMLEEACRLVAAC